MSGGGLPSSAAPTLAVDRPAPSDLLSGGVRATGQPDGRARYAVLGLGNRLQADEALGGLVIDRLQDQAELLAPLPDPTTVELIDGGTVGLGLLPYLSELDGLVIVDIIDAGARPGSLVDLAGSSVLDRDAVIGVHDLGASEILGALLFMDALPRRVRVVGLQPAAIELGVALSTEVAAGLPALLGAVVEHLASWQAEDVAAEG